jgi:hypothetical protein
MGEREHRESMIGESSQMGAPALTHGRVMPARWPPATGGGIGSATKQRPLPSAPSVLRKAAPSRRIDAAITAAARSRCAADGAAQWFLAEIINLP